MGCRVFKNNGCKVTFKFKGASHKGIDLVGPGATFDYVVAHSDGTVVAVVSNINYNTSKTGKRIYGNYVKIRHDNGMYTLYAHMKYGSIAVSKGQRVSKGQVLGYMGNTGYAFGAHLHFEVRDENDKYIDPTPYVDGDLPAPKMPEPTPSPVELKYNIGDRVKINGVYLTSMSDEKLDPAITVGTITDRITDKKTGAKNPYLLDNGNIGWVNDDVIVGIYEEPVLNNSIEVGDKVRVKRGAKSYDGVALASFVFKNTYTVMDLNGSRAVIGKDGAVTTAIHIDNLYK